MLISYAPNLNVDGGMPYDPSSLNNFLTKPSNLLIFRAGSAFSGILLLTSSAILDGSDVVPSGIVGRLLWEAPQRDITTQASGMTGFNSALEANLRDGYPTIVEIDGLTPSGEQYAFCCGDRKE